MVVCVGVRNFCLFPIVFVPVSCFKLVFFRKAIMGCKLFNISLKLLSMLNKCQCLFIVSVIFGNTGLYVNKMVLRLYIWVYNVLKVMMYLGGQPSQFVFLQSIHYDPFQQIFLLGIRPRLNILCLILSA